MLRNLRTHLTFANVASALALFIVLGTGAAYAAGTIGSGDVIDESLRSADLKDGAAVKSSDVKDAPSGSDAIDADTVDGENAAQLASGRIRAVGSVIDFPSSGGPRPLLPGLDYQWACRDESPSEMQVFFSTTEEQNGTANAMTVASGVESQGDGLPSGFAPFNFANGTSVRGQPYTGGIVTMVLPNTSGESIAETQLIINAGARTYSVALHQYMRESDGYCEASGTATLGE